MSWASQQLMDPLLLIIAALLIFSGILPRFIWRAGKYCFERPPRWRKESGNVFTATSAESKINKIKEEDLHFAHVFSKAHNCEKHRYSIYRMQKNRSRFDRLIDELMPFFGERRAKNLVNKIRKSRKR